MVSDNLRLCPLDGASRAWAEDQKATFCPNISAT